MRLAVPIAVLALFVPRLPLAQTVRGELVERGAGSPIRGALVVLLDEDGRRAGAALTGADGSFVLRAPRAGTFTLRGERVGFRSTTSGPVTLGVDQTVTYRMEGDAAAVSLRGITARSGRRCRVRPGAGPATAVLWEEARKALSAAAHAEQERLLRYDLVVFARELAPGSDEVLRDERRELSQQTSVPFVTTSPDTLSARGWVRVEGDSVVYDAPDAQVLLSDRFLAEHCFRVQEDAARPGLVGLAFEPLRSRRLPEVAGVLWLDRASAELTLLEYRYVRLPDAVPEAGAGGKVEFERLPNGKWIVARWSIRMPQFVLVPTAPALRGTRPAAWAMVPRLSSVRENGGLVVAASIREARTPGRVGTVAGVVWDSLHGRPLPGARVFLSGTEWAATSDAAGRFTIAQVAEGLYSATFSHPVLKEWSTVPRSVRVEVAADTVARVELAFPAIETLVKRHCEPGELRRHSGVVIGIVSTGSAPHPGATVRFMWPEMSESGRVVRYPRVEVKADENGFYAACGIPTDVRLDVLARGEQAVFRGRHMLRGFTLRFDIRLQHPLLRR